MKNAPPYESPIKAKKKKRKHDIIVSYREMKKNPKNNVSEWKRRIAIEYGISEYTVLSYLRDMNKN